MPNVADKVQLVAKLDMPTYSLKLQHDLWCQQANSGLKEIRTEHSPQLLCEEEV